MGTDVSSGHSLLSNSIFLVKKEARLPPEGKDTGGKSGSLRRKEVSGKGNFLGKSAVISQQHSNHIYS